MKRQYTMGLATNQIQAGVNVGTRGIAYTAMYLVRSGGQSNQLAESDATGDGDIPVTGLGEAQTLANSYLVVRTIINFYKADLSEADSAQDVKNLVIRYTFTGGLSGDQVYDFDTDDIIVAPDNSQASVTKAIELL